jgi:DNA-binding NarL/FixJ family response regulator
MTNIILADSEAIFTAGIARILAVDENTEVVAQCSDYDQMQRVFLRLEDFGSRGVVIADAKASPTAYLHQGFRGVVFRDVTSKSLLDCVRRVAAGGVWQPPLPVDLTSPENDILGMQACNQLTSKQLRVVAYVVQGMRTEEIANRLNSTEPSIKTHLRSIYMKLRVSDRLDLAMFALRHPALMKALAGMRKSFDPQCQVAEKENEVA